MTTKAEFLKATPSDGIIDVIYPEDEKITPQTAAEKAEMNSIDYLNSFAEEGAKIVIHLQEGNGQQSQIFVESHPADKYTIDELVEKMQREHGGGDYRFRIYKDGKVQANRLITIKKKLSTNQGYESDNLFSAVKTMMYQQQQFFNNFMAQQQQPQNRTEMLNEMLLYKQLFAQPSGGGIGQLKELMEMQTLLKEMTEPKEESDGFGSIIRESIPLLTTMAQAASGQVPRRPQPSGPTPNVRQRRTNPTNNGVDPQMKMAVDHLVKLAKQNQPAGDVADEIVNTMPQMFLPQIEQIAISKNPIDVLGQFNVEINQHREWVLDLCEWLKAYFGHESKYSSEFDDDLTDDEKSDNNSTNEPDDL